MKGDIMLHTSMKALKKVFDQLPGIYKEFEITAANQLNASVHIHDNMIELAIHVTYPDDYLQVKFDCHGELIGVFLTCYDPYTDMVLRHKMELDHSCLTPEDY
jgi:hypothetical protein